MKTAAEALETAQNRSFNRNQRRVQHCFVTEQFNRLSCRCSFHVAQSIEDLRTGTCQGFRLFVCPCRDVGRTTLLQHEPSRLRRYEYRSGALLLMLTRSRFDSTNPRTVGAGYCHLRWPWRDRQQQRQRPIDLHANVTLIGGGLRAHLPQPEPRVPLGSRAAAVIT